MNAFLTLTGIETLPLRMERHCSNAKAVAGFLRDHPAVAWVSYPALPGQEGEALAARYVPQGPGSIFTVALKGGQPAAVKFIMSLKLISHLVNIGEIKSLAIHPATTTHRQLSFADKAAAMVGPETVRLSIGLENAEDLNRRRGTGPGPDRLRLSQPSGRSGPVSSPPRRAGRLRRNQGTRSAGMGRP